MYAESSLAKDWSLAAEQLGIEESILAWDSALSGDVSVTDWITKSSLARAQALYGDVLAIGTESPRVHKR